MVPGLLNSHTKLTSITVRTVLQTSGPLAAAHNTTYSHSNTPNSRLVAGRQGVASHWSACSPHGMLVLYDCLQVYWAILAV